MGKQEIAGLACKLLGIYLIIQGINVMANIIPSYWFAPQQGFSNYIFVTIFPFLSLIIFGVLLWFLSDKLAIIMIKGEARYRERPGIKASDIQRVAFSVLGLLWLGSSIPKLVSTLVNFYSMKEIPDSNSNARLFGTLGLAGVITQIIIGLGIFLGSQGLVNLLQIVRNAGMGSKNDFDDSEEP